MAFLKKNKETLYTDDILSYIFSELERRKSERAPLEQQWVLNSNFLIGNQYCDINTFTGEVEQYGAVYDYLEHEVFNQIAPIMETRMSNLEKINYAVSVKPSTNDIEDYEKAKTATALLRYAKEKLAFDEKKNNLMSWAELTGSAFALSWWDETLSEEGDLNFGLLTPYEVYPESLFKQSIEEQRSIIVEQVMSKEDIFDKYNIETDGKDIDTFSITPINSSGGFGYTASALSIQTQKMKNAERVITYFERASRRYPEGRLITVIGDKIVHYGPLPYDSIPLTILRSKEIPGQFFGRSVIQDLIPLQRAYNGCMNSIHDYIKSATVSGWIVEDGAIDTEEFEINGTAPGSILSYRKGYAPPKPMESAKLPDAITYQCQKLKNDMEYCAGVSQLMVTGATPTGITSGVAIGQLREIDTTRLAIIGENFRNALKLLARTWLSIYRRYADGYRIINVVGKNNAYSVVSWCKEDLNSFDIYYDTESELKFSEDSQKAAFLQAFQMGLFTDENGKVPEAVKAKIIECLKIGSFGQISETSELQSQAAQRENEFLTLGVLPSVSEIDDHNIHAEEHTRYMLQTDFSVLQKKAPEVAESLVAHIREHNTYKERRITNQNDRKEK